MAGQESRTEKLMALVTVCSAQVGGNGTGSAGNSGCENQGSCARSVKLSQSSVVAVATGGGKPGTVNDQGSTVACVRAEEKQC